MLTKALLFVSALAPPLAFPAAPVASDTVPRAQGRDAPDVSGNWSTSRGPMALKQRGERVAGTLGFEGETELAGTIEGRSLRLAWSYRSDEGKVELELHENGSWLGGSIDGKEITAYRVEPALPDARALASGDIVTGQSTSGMNMHVHAPDGWNGKRELPMLVLLHGSNMTARAYVNTVVQALPDLAKRYVLVGFDGERPSPFATPDRPAFNYTYVEFSGPGVGERWRQRQSPALVAEAIEELRSEWSIDSVIVGGHSQGGFLTWVMALHYPEMLRGAFPMSCNLLVQCEPDRFDDKELAVRHRVALAPIHGENDGVVEFSGGLYAHRRMLDAGFPALRFFTDEHAAHMFARLPVQQAVEWIEGITSEDGGELLRFAAEAMQGEDPRPRDALAAIERARQTKAGRGLKRKLDSLEKAIAERIEDEAEPLLAAIRADRDGSWLDDFHSFRARYGPADAARPVLAAYAALRKKHEGPADRLFGEARNASSPAARKEKYAEIVERYYASKWAIHARDWMQ
jgi:pimeloyl-ACP methyl ester carboxylesterase